VEIEVHTGRCRRLGRLFTFAGRTISARRYPWSRCVRSTAGLHVTLRARLRPLAPGLTPRAVLEKFAAIQMLDVHFPTAAL
jgi:hypothetical protein